MKAAVCNEFGALVWCMSWTRVDKADPESRAGAGATGVIEAVLEAAGEGALLYSVEQRGGTERIVTITDPVAAVSRVVQGRRAGG